MKTRRRVMVGVGIRLAGVLLAASMLCAQGTTSPTTTAPRPAAAPAAQPATVPTADNSEALLLVKRIYVDSFGDDAISKELSAAIVSALTDSQRFIVTENKDKADATLRGSGLEKTSQEFHS